MRFITENDLRARYKTQPFTSYEPQDGERLTPGARQFLIDRGINMYGECPKPAQSPKPVKETAAEDTARKQLKLKLEALRIDFLFAVKALLASDVEMAQQLTALGRQLSLLPLALDGKCEVADLHCQPCAGITPENMSQELGDCVDVSEFCMQLEQAQTLLELAKLRNSLRLFQLELSATGIDEPLKETLGGKINQIINRLSQMICTTKGGKECQRNA